MDDAVDDDVDDDQSEDMVCNVGAESFTEPSLSPRMIHFF